MPVSVGWIPDELALQTGTNVGLGVQEELSVLYVEYSLGEANPNRLQRTGFRVPLVRTAMGRACIAGMRPEQRERLFEHLKTYYKREWPVLRQQLDDAVQQVHISGYCVATGTFNTNTNSVAVPFVQADGETILAFNSQGHAQRPTPAVMARNGKRLLEMAQQVRRRLADAPVGPSLGWH